MSSLPGRDPGMCSPGDVGVPHAALTDRRKEQGQWSYKSSFILCVSGRQTGLVLRSRGFFFLS